jgi:transglutaminase-like putative cysteine protease
MKVPRWSANRRTLVTVAVMACIAMSGAVARLHADGGAAVPVPNVVTADIQAGIEKHVEEHVRLGEGYFTLAHGENVLRLKLVRVHTEYLANLGPRRHFACVDLADISGDVYDVDFFLEGDPRAMRVTETTVHKINGQPYYAWEQTPDKKTWVRVPVDQASRKLLGVIRDRDAFDFYYQVTLPKLNERARLWLPYPASDEFQEVTVKRMDLPREWRVLEDRDYHNKILFLELGPEDSGKPIDIVYRVQRREKAAYPASEQSFEKYLAPERFVPLDEKFKRIAEEILAGKTGDLVRARALYDHVIDRLRYMKFGPGWGRGDAAYACDAGSGNCSEYHSYFNALARTGGIPARFAIGAAIPSDRDDGGIDGYHCWAEFYTEGKWWSVDISEADKYTSLATYYFGHQPANRFELSRGRDLVVEPGPESGPINFLAYPVLEVAGKPALAKTLFAFRRMHLERTDDDEARQ